MSSEPNSKPKAAILATNNSTAPIPKTLLIKRRQTSNQNKTLLKHNTHKSMLQKTSSRPIRPLFCPDRNKPTLKKYVDAIRTKQENQKRNFFIFFYTIDFKHI
ncbi:MAG TPA: hypothetical protein PK513_03825 [Alphaproteobacteria bacterium]|nr:hypothetical protein [Alphaproteobacteria bacterium]